MLFYFWITHYIYYIV